MPATFGRSALCAACALTLWSGQASAGFFDDVVDTLPGGLAASSDGFFSAQLSGFREIVDKGRDGIAFGIWTEHPSFDYDNRSEENALPFGGGVVRTVIDEKGNERMLFGLVFSDSHYYPEPTLGYSWVARWPVSEKYHVGAGYLLGFTFREDYHWCPIPLPLPVVKAGTVIDFSQQPTASKTVCCRPLKRRLSSTSSNFTAPGCVKKPTRQPNAATW